ncbi:MAG: nucleoside monophosphate kinase [Candidatus Saccharibacteria bacterium]|nr:nucleoside monophosphate kinase [Candidatus Saccharibacteria bacterium]
MRIIFLGGPGSGKSTVGKRLAADLKWPWISIGDILRQSSEEWVKEKLKTAELFDDEMVTGLLLSQLTGVENVIIDGYPRNLRQAELTVERDMRIDLIVEMDVPVEETVNRLVLRGRDQDSREIIEQRWQMFMATETEIIAYLTGNGAKIIKVDGVGEPDEVYKRAVNAIVEEINRK